jgi:hypothetical protein
MGCKRMAAFPYLSLKTNWAIEAAPVLFPLAVTEPFWLNGKQDLQEENTIMATKTIRGSSLILGSII